MKRKKSKIFSTKYFLQDLLRITGAIPLLIALRPKRMYISASAKKKIKGGAIIACNHRGYFDPMCVMASIWYRRHHFVAMKEMFDTKRKKFWFTKAFLCFPIDREVPNIAEIRAIVAALKEDKLVTIFPEGHISENEDGEMNEFKSGMVLMAVMSGKPIIPMYLQKRQNVWQRLRVGIGEPIYVDDEERKKAPLEYMDKLSKQIYEKEKELQELCKRRKK